MGGELSIQLLQDGWRLEHTKWGGDAIVIRHADGIIVHEPKPKPEIMVTPTAFVVRGEYRA